MKRYIFTLLAFIIAVCVCGCFGYRVGTLLPKDLKTIFVPAFKNITNEPNLEIRATNAVVDRLNIDGTLKTITDKENADTLLEATIIKYDRKPVRFSGGSTPSEYRLTLSAKVTFMNLRTGIPLWSDKIITGKAEFPVRGNLPSSETAALPAAFEDLAHNIVQAIVEGWE
jgi:hypothetical protein